jgi:hypothetical protein
MTAYASRHCSTTWKRLALALILQDFGRKLLQNSVPVGSGVRPRVFILHRLYQRPVRRCGCQVEPFLMQMRMLVGRTRGGNGQLTRYIIGLFHDALSRYHDHFRNPLKPVSIDGSVNF